MKQFLFSLLLLCGLAASALGQVDIRINQIGPYIDLARNVTWGNGPGGIGNNYILTPTNPDQGVCLYINNGSATNESANIVYAITGDQALNTYTGNTTAWSVASQTISDVRVPAHSVVSNYVKLTGTARLTIAINSSGSSGVTPASAFVVLTNSGGCGFSANPPAVPLRIFAGTSFQLTQSYVASACVTNPTAGQMIVALQSTASGIRAFYLDRVWISSSAAGEVDFVKLSSLGTTPTSVTIFNPSMGAGIGSALLAKTEPYVADPTIGSVVYRRNLAAGSTTDIDLSGFYQRNITGALGLVGVSTPAGITGLICAEIQWSENN